MSDVLGALYRRRFGAAATDRQRVWEVLIDAWFGQYVDRSATVLDLGCGWGTFINQIDVAKRYAIDLNPDAPTHVDSDVELFVQPAEQRWPIGNDELDLVFTSNFLEHLPDRNALATTLAEAYRTLRPGGRVVCLGPNIARVGGRYWDFFDHLIPLTEKSLAEALEVTGFEITEALRSFLPYTMDGKPPPPEFAIRAYLKLRPVWPLLGRQFLVVAEKPQG